MTIAENVTLIKEKIAAAAEKSGRSPEDIILVAATKMNDASRVRQAIDAGICYCGENRVQELLEKNEQSAYEGSHIHFIGHLQKNKVKHVVGLAELIHSADSIELLRTIGKTASAAGIVQDVLLEINIGNEESKSGFSIGDITDELLSAVSEIPGVRVRGLMAIPPICSTGAENIPFFQQMNQLFIDIQSKKYDNVFMDFLSMGMSGDYEEAILCGSNMVRVGSGIFGPRIYPEAPSHGGKAHGFNG